MARVAAFRARSYICSCRVNSGEMGKVLGRPTKAEDVLPQRPLWMQQHAANQSPTQVAVF